MTPLRVGDVLGSDAEPHMEGFCGGYFGRDSYDPKRVEAIGADWVVAREIRSGHALFANCSPDQLIEFRLGQS